MVKELSDREIVAALEKIKAEEHNGLLRIALAAGISPWTLHRLMRGVSLKPVTMRKIAAALNGKAVR